MADNNVEVEEKKGGKLVGFLITILIILIWLGIFVALIKLDVGGFGSSVMKPIFKDVPIIKEILPVSKEEEESEYPYKSIAEAAEYIKQLELELQTYQESNDNDAETIKDLRAEVERLKVFEEEKKQFEEEKKAFYEEVVFGENAPSLEEYQQYYALIDPDNAAAIARQVEERLAYSALYQDFAKTYSQMDPEQAAAIFVEMTGDLNTVAGILNAMKAADRGAIVGAIGDLDSVFAGKLTVLLEPME